MPLTVKQIEAARFGVDKERLGDGGGLYLRLLPNGAKRFQVQLARACALTEDRLSIKAIRIDLGGPAQQVPDACDPGEAHPGRRKSKTKRPVAVADHGVLLRNVARRWLPSNAGTSHGVRTTYLVGCDRWA
jgi:hypothetical protein